MGGRDGRKDDVLTAVGCYKIFRCDIELLATVHARMLRCIPERALASL